MKKNFKLIMMLLCIAVIFSCEEESKSPLIDGDGVAPGSVSDVSVTNFAGGSTIVFNSPGDSDIQNYEAVFYRSANSEASSVKTSVYNNELTIDGFARSGEHKVDLYTVDESGNRSAPVAVTINPLRPPYLDVCSSIYAEPTFGGLNVFWDNPTAGAISVELYSVGDDGGLIFEALIETSSTLGQGQILDLVPEETDFVFIVKDGYGNQCNQIEFTAEPLYIEIFDRSLYRGILQPFDQTHAFDGWELEKVIDGIFGGNQGFHTIAISESADTEPVLPYYQGHQVDGAGYRVPLFTVDMGDLYRVYRFKYWPRTSNWIWRHGNPKRFDLWGSDKLNPDGSLDGWTLLLDDVEVVKPSGTHCPDPDFHTEEDAAAAEAGFSFDLSPDNPRFRYMRFAQREAINCFSTLLHISEVQFQGDNREGI